MVGAVTSSAAHAQETPAATSIASESATTIAKELQNPLGRAYVLPFQNNTNFNVGPRNETQDTLNIQPVIPMRLNDDLKLITRTVLPLAWGPTPQPGSSQRFGINPTSFAAFLSPNRSIDGWGWGAGPIVQMPTITDKAFGSNVWGIGPAFVFVKSAGPFVMGGYLNNAFSLGGTSGRGATRYGLLTINPFVHYNFGDGWFLSITPIITADEQSSGAKWTLPAGAQIGRVVKIGGKLPVNLLIGAYYNVVRPQSGGAWQLRTVAAFIF